MTVESASYINGLNATYPTGTDAKAEGDDHIRLIKTTVKATFPNIVGPVTLTDTQINAAVVRDASANVSLGGASAAATTRLTLQDTGAARAYTAAVTDFSVLHINGAYANTTYSAITYTSGGGGGAAIAFSRDGANGTAIQFFTNSTGNAVALAASVAMTVGSNGTVTIPGTLAASLPWTSVTGKPTNVSAFTNDAGYITSVASVTWASVTGKPTNVSYFTNDVAYLTTISSGNVTAALGYTPANPAVASAVNATTVTATGLIYGRSGAGTGLGRITTTTTTGSPAGTAQGDIVLVY